MAFQSGLVDVTSPALGYIRFVKHLLDFMRGSHVDDVAVGSSGGSGYTAGDILTIAGGTTYGDSNHVAQLEVTAVDGGGAVTEVRLIQSGSYSTEPATLTDNAATGGTGSGIDIDVTMDSWMIATVNAGGSGYTLGDTLTLVGGTPSTPATFEVTGESSGVVTAVRLIDVGDYSELPSNPAATSGGTGAGCTLDLDRIGWMLLTDNYTDDQTEWEFIAQGRNHSGIDPVVGFRTATVTNGGPRVQMFCATAYSDLLTWDQQPGSSPTDDPNSSQSANDSTVPLTDGDIDFFFFVNPRRIILVPHVGTTYELGYVGCWIPYHDSPATGYPAPFICAGTVSRSTESITSGESSLHCIVLRHQGAGGGQFLRDVGGVWRPGAGTGAGGAWQLWPWLSQFNVQNWEEGAAPELGSPGNFLRPAGAFDDDWEDRWYAQAAASTGGYASFGIGNRTYLCEPYTIFQDEAGALQLLGELDGCFAIQGVGLIVEDIVRDQEGRDHQVFAALNSNDADDFYTIIRE